MSSPKLPLSELPPVPPSRARSPHTLGGIALVVAAVCCSVALVEVFARHVIPRVSKVESRVSGEAAAARALLRSPAPEGSRLLVVGNSLLEASVQPDLLTAAMRAGGWRAQRFAMEATNYTDWYLGLRRLFRSTGKPEAVMLLLSPRQFAWSGVRGSYSAYHLFSPGDAVRAGLRAGMHPTEVAGLVFGSASAYYGLRVELRQFFLKKLVPGVEVVADRIARHHQGKAETPVPTDEASLGRHLDELKRLCDEHRVRCVLALSTELQPVDWAPRLARLGQARGLSTEAIAPTVSFDASDYQADRYHMSPQGAQKYTTELAARLLAVLGPGQR